MLFFLFFNNRAPVHHEALSFSYNLVVVLQPYLAPLSYSSFRINLSLLLFAIDSGLFIVEVHNC